MRKPVSRVFELVPCGPGCKVIEDGQRLEIADLDRTVVVLSVQRKQRR